MTVCFIEAPDNIQNLLDLGKVKCCVVIDCTEPCEITRCSVDAVLRGIDVGGGCCGSNIHFQYKFRFSEAVPENRRFLKVGRNEFPLQFDVKKFIEGATLTLDVRFARAGLLSSDLVCRGTLGVVS